MAYTTSNAVAAYLGLESADDDALLTTLIARAQAAIDEHCGRTFEAVTETRYYRPEHLIENSDGQELLLLDKDLLTVTTLTNGNGLTISGTYYELWPRNATAKRFIRLKTTHSGWSFDDGDSVITVAGTWGKTATAPADVVQACTRLAAYFYRQRDVSDFDVAQIAGDPAMRVPKGIPSDVMALLKNHRDISRSIA